MRLYRDQPFVLEFSDEAHSGRNPGGDCARGRHVLRAGRFLRAQPGATAHGGRPPRDDDEHAMGDQCVHDRRRCSHDSGRSAWRPARAPPDGGGRAGRLRRGVIGLWPVLLVGPTDRISGSARPPFIGGLLTEQLSWRWVFFLNVPLSAIAIFCCLRWLPSMPPAGAKMRIDWLGLSLVSSGIGGVAVAAERRAEGGVAP